MKLKSVHIHRHWGNTRQFSCKVDFEGLHGDVSLNLNEDMAQRILEVCADLVVEAGQETAREIQSKEPRNGWQRNLDLHLSF